MSESVSQNDAWKSGAPLKQLRGAFWPEWRIAVPAYGPLSQGTLLSSSQDNFFARKPIAIARQPKTATAANATTCATDAAEAGVNSVESVSELVPCVESDAPLKQLTVEGRVLISVTVGKE